MLDQSAFAEWQRMLVKGLSNGDNSVFDCVIFMKFDTFYVCFVDIIISE